MANRRPQGNRHMDFGRNDRGPKNFGRSGVSPWQGGGPGGGIPNLLPLSGGSTEATLALASNIINLLQPRPNPVPSLLDMPIRRDFGHNMGRYDRPFGPNRMGNQGNFRRTGNYNRAGERINTNRKPFRPHDGQRQQYKSFPRKDADYKAKNGKESEEEKPEGDGDTSKQEDKQDSIKTRYDDINPQLLKCHICNKIMWDGRSFENHLSGRAHAIMMQKTAESYALTADTMRQEFKIREMKFTRRSGQQPPRDFYCAMCDLYAADGAIHRTTVGHRKLKKYLHPTCTSCHKEMPTRIELDEHRLTAEHLRNMQGKSDVFFKPKPEVMVLSTLNMEQMYLRDDRQRWRSDRERKSQAEPLAEEKQDDATEEKKDGAEVEASTVEKAEDGEATATAADAASTKHPLDKEDTILDYKEGDDLTNISVDMMPVYSTERGVGRSFLSEFRCVQCTLCRKLLDGEETAEVHLRTWRHHQLFNRLLGDRGGIKQTYYESRKRARANSEDEGNWKRRKNQDGEEAEETGEGEEAGLGGEAVEGEDAAGQNGHAADGEGKDEGVEEKDVAGEGVGEIKKEMEDIEDWEQSVDEILKDEANHNEEAEEALLTEENESEEKTEEPAQAPKPEPEPEPEPKPEPEVEEPPAQSPVEKPTRGRGTPRGRGRGRRRNY